MAITGTGTATVSQHYSVRLLPALNGRYARPWSDLTELRVPVRGGGF